MKEILLNEIPLHNLVKILQRIPFYRDVYERNCGQLQFLLKHSKIIYLDPGETIINKGEIDFWIYSVVKGMLRVTPDQTDNPDNIVDYIGPGEMFGELAVILEAPRNATVTANENSKQIILFGTDFSPFGELDDFSRVALHTKLIFYKRALRVTYKRLFCYQIDHPEHDFTHRSLAPDIYSGKPETLEELEFYYHQSMSLAGILQQWNQTLESQMNPNKQGFDIKDIESL